jgi:voltage-gated sodium channel
MSHDLRSNRITLITESSVFRRVVITLILLNAIIVGLETYPEIRADYERSLNIADTTILYLFALELILR